VTIEYTGPGGASAAQTVLTASDVTAPLSAARAGFRSGYVFELIRSGSPAPEASIVLVLNPTRYDLTEPHASALTPGSGGNVVDESIGIVMRDLVVEGTFGVLPRTGTGTPGAGASAGAKSGDEHFRELRNLFRRYSDMKRDPQFGPQVKLIFHSLRDDDHFVIAQPVFSTPRGAKTRMHYSYRIQAKVIGLADGISRFRSFIPEDAFTFTDAMRDVSDAFNDARAAFVTVNNAIQTIERKVGNIQAVMISVSGFMNAVGAAISNGGRLIIDYPFRLAASLANDVANAADSLAESILDGTVGAVNDAERSLREIENAIDRIAMFPDHFRRESGSDIARRYLGDRALSANDLVSGTGGATPGSRLARTLGSARDAGIDLEETGAVTSIRVSASTTLEGVANRYGTSVEALIVQNNLQPPYLHPGGGPGLLKPGDTMLVPVLPSASGGPPVSPNPEFDVPEEAIFGVDFALDPAALLDGVLDVLVDELHGATDAALARGVQNLVQGLEITCHTERGGTKYIPDLGLMRNVGARGTLDQVLLASLALRDAVVSDPRIQGIMSSRVVLEEDRLYQEITPIVIGQQSGVPLSLPFGTVQGD
jgi:hypothetical protein